MSWVKLDDRYAHHPKICAAGPLAMALDVAGMCHAARHETDGHIASAALAAVAPFLSKAKALQAAAKLVEVGRWSKTAGGWQIHDFLAYNPSAKDRAAMREQTEQRREADRQRKRASRGRPNDVRADKNVTSTDVRTPPRPHPRPAEGGDGDPPKSPHPRPPSGPASPEPSQGADSAGQTHPRPALQAVPSDPGDQPNGQVPALSAALRAQVASELDAAFGPRWREAVAPKTSESPEEFEARRARELARFEAKFEQELNENRSSSDPESNENRSETVQELSEK